MVVQSLKGLWMFYLTLRQHNTSVAKIKKNLITGVANHLCAHKSLIMLFVINTEFAPKWGHKHLSSHCVHCFIAHMLRWAPTSENCSMIGSAISSSPVWCRYLEQWFRLVNCIIRNNLLWNSVHSTKHLSRERICKYRVQNGAIISMPQSIKSLSSPSFMSPCFTFPLPVFSWEVYDQTLLGLSYYQEIEDPPGRGKLVLTRHCGSVHNEWRLSITPVAPFTNMV